MFKFSVPTLITGFPEKDDAFIGWFMVDGQKQRQGIGSQIFADVRAAMAGQAMTIWHYPVKRPIGKLSLSGNLRASRLPRKMGFGQPLKEKSKVFAASLQNPYT